jgi:hypothetical protein
LVSTLLTGVRTQVAKLKGVGDRFECGTIESNNKTKSNINWNRIFIRRICNGRDTICGVGRTNRERKL